MELINYIINKYIKYMELLSCELSNSKLVHADTEVSLSEL